MGLTDTDLRRLQEELLANPKMGSVMQGTGGIRKLRFAFEDGAPHSRDFSHELGAPQRVFQNPPLTVCKFFVNGVMLAPANE